jgi:hypothetical protein
MRLLSIASFLADDSLQRHAMHNKDERYQLNLRAISTSAKKVDKSMIYKLIKLRLIAIYANHLILIIIRPVN